MPSRNRTFSSWNPSTQWKGSRLASRTLTGKVQQNTDRTPAEQNSEYEAFQQQKFEALGIQLKARNGGITTGEQERLGTLHTQMDDFWTQKQQGSPRIHRSLQTGRSTPSQTSINSNDSKGHGAQTQAKIDNK